MERREILGSVVLIQTSSAVLSSDMTISVIDGSTFPDGSSGKPFVIVLNRGTPLEEKILCSLRVGGDFTVSSRGYDGTSPQNHANGTRVDHVLDAAAMQDMNDSLYDTQVMYWMEAH